jgi:hypothetical protein
VGDSPRKLLIVEDDPGIQSQLRWCFEDYEVIAATERGAAINELRRHEPPVVYHKEDVRMTWDDMCNDTGLSRPAVGRAIDAIENRGFFKRGRRSMWSVNSNKLLLNKGANSNNSELNEQVVTDENSNDKLLYDSNNKLPASSYKEKEEKKEDPPTPQKPKRKAQAKPKLLTADDFEIPSELDGPEFRELFEEWIAMRAETKKLKPVTLRAGKMQLKLLIPFGRVWSINRLKKGIASQWAGLVFDDDIPGAVHLNGSNGHKPKKLADKAHEGIKW